MRKKKSRARFFVCPFFCFFFVGSLLFVFFHLHQNSHENWLRVINCRLSVLIALCCWLLCHKCSTQLLRTSNGSNQNIQSVSVWFSMNKTPATMQTFCRSLQCAENSNNYLLSNKRRDSTNHEIFTALSFQLKRQTQRTVKKSWQQKNFTYRST